MRELRRKTRQWSLEGTPLAEFDEYRHLGILRTVSPSSTARTFGRATAGRSSFYSLNSVGTCAGCLHPLTSSRLYRALCLPILLYGSELWLISKTERLYLERVHRKILRTFMGLPVRCPASYLSTLFGLDNIDTLISQRQLGFLVATANLPCDSLPRRVLHACALASPSKGVIREYEKLIVSLGLPNVSHIMTSSPKPSSWKSFTSKNLAIRSYLNFLECCEDYVISSCDIKLAKPILHWGVTVGDCGLTRKNFRIRMLVGCDGLNRDSSRFHNRRDDPLSAECALCRTSIEDPYHFIATCSALAYERLDLLSSAPQFIREQLPDPVVCPRDFADVVTGVGWVDNLALQWFCVEFLHSLKLSHNLKILNTSP